MKIKGIASKLLKSRNIQGKPLMKNASLCSNNTYIFSKKQKNVYLSSFMNQKCFFVTEREDTSELKKLTEALKDISDDRSPPKFSGAVVFDTYQVVNELEKCGFSRSQCNAILTVLITTVEDSSFKNLANVATKDDLDDLKDNVREAVFTSTLKFDNSTRHLKDLIDRDMKSQKSDILSKMDADFSTFRNDTDRKRYNAKEEIEQEITDIKLEVLKVEKRLLQYGVGGVSSLILVCLALARLLL